MIKNKPVWRRRIAVLLAALLVLSVLPVTGEVYADDDDEVPLFGAGNGGAKTAKLTLTKSVETDPSESSVGNDKTYTFTISDGNGNTQTVEIIGSGYKTVLLPADKNGDYTITENTEDIMIPGYQWTGTNNTYTVHVIANDSDYQSGWNPPEYISSYSTSSGDLTITNKYKASTAGNLTVSKTVAGDGGDTSKEWHFKVELSDKTFNTRTDAPSEEFKFENGVASFTLKSGESKKASGLPVNVDYTVTEEEANTGGYVTTYTGNTSGTIPNDGGDLNVAFTNTLNYGKLTITKQVEGGGTTATGKTYTFDVTGPNSYSHTVTITGNDSTTLTDLVPGEYTITEQDANIPGYKLEVPGETTVTVTAESVANATITNTYTELGKLKLTKTVVADGLNAADKVYTFTVTGPERYSETVELKAGETKTLENLVPGTYTVTEDKTGAEITGWDLSVTSQVTVTVDAGKTAEATITNKYTPKPGNLTITKKVVGGGDEAAEKTYNFTVKGPSYPTGCSVSLKAGETEKLENLVPGEYTVTEDKDGAEIENWSLEVTVEGTATVVAEGNAEVEVTNTYTRLKGDLTVTKTVAGDDAEYDRVWNFTVTLSDTSVNGTYGDMTFENGVAKFTLKHEESKTATGLPAGVGYTVTEAEANEDGYYTTSTDAEGTIPANGEAKESFKNERPKPDEPTSGSLIIAKTVKGGGTEAAEREYEFTITGPNGFTKTVKVKGGDKSKAIEVDPGTYTITEENGEIGGFTHTVTINNGEEVTVEKGKELTVEVINDYTPNPGKLTITKAIVGGGTEAAGKTYTFTITGPTWPDGHDVTVTGAGSVTVDVAPGTYTVTEKDADIPGYTLEVSDGGEVTVESDKTVDVTVTNTYTENPKGDLTVTKTVTGTAGDQTKDWTFTVTLSDTTISGVYGGMTFTDGVATFTLKHGESKTATGLPAGTGYTVTEAEANADGYTTTAEGETGTIPAGGTAEAKFVNDKETPPPPPPTEPTTGSLTVSKAIVGGGTAAAEKTYTFTVTGPSWPEGRTLTVTGAGSVTLSNLTPGTYTVTEADAGISGYDWTVSGEGGVTVEAGRNSHITITNTYNDTEPDTGRLTVTKAIVGGGDAAAAKTYTFTVTGPDGYTNTVTVTGAGRVTLTDLVPGAYTVTEQDASIPGWTLEVTGGGEVTVEAGKTAETTITNTYTETEKETGSLTVTKAVAGGGSAAAGKTYTFTVTGPDGYTNTVTVTGAGSATLTDLVPGTYTVTEQDASIPGWTLEVTGGGEVTVEAGKTAETTVTNTYTEIPYGGLTVRKIVDGEGGDKEMEFHFTVTLSDTSISGAYGGMTFTNGVAAFTLKHGESVTAEGLPSGIGYTVTEAEANTDGYVSTSTGADGAIPHGGAALAEFRNSKGLPTPGTGRLVIRKAVTGSEGDKDKVFHFTVTLSDTSINGAYGDLTFVNGVAEFTLRSGENKWAKELPAGTGYTVTETEADQDGYTTTITGATGTIPENSYGVWAEARFLNHKGPEPEEPENPDEPEDPFEELFDPDIPLSDMPDEPFDDAPGTGGSYQLGLWTALAALSLVGMLLAVIPLISVNGRHVKRKGRGEKGR